MNTNKPYLIKLNKIANKGGDLSFMDENLPFEIKRVFWVYNVKSNIKRGSHAHANSDKCIICLNKSVTIKLTNQNNIEYKFKLSDPSDVLYFPKMHWIDLDYEVGAVVLVLASSTFNNDQFIEDINSFRSKES